MPCPRSERAGAADMVNDRFSSAQPPGETFDELLARLEAEAGITSEPATTTNGNRSDPLRQGGSHGSHPLPDRFERIGASVFDRLTELMTWSDILEPLGWQQVRPPDAATAEAWKRPGGTHPVSAKVLKAAPWALVNWSEDSGLPVGAGQKQTMARVLAHFHYSRNESALAKDRCITRSFLPSASLSFFRAHRSMNATPIAPTAPASAPKMAAMP